MLVVKYAFINFRDRVVQLFIIVLLLTSFFIYHHATSNEIYQPTTLTTHRESPGHVGRSILNTSGKVGEPSSGPSTISDKGIPHESNNISGNPAPRSISSTQSTSQSPTASVALKTTEKSIVEEVEKRHNLEVNDAGPFKNGSIGATFRGGHSVRIPEKCPDFGIRLKLLVMITSAPSNEQARTSIRQTWGHFGQRKDVSMVFILGETNDTKVNDALLVEQKTYGDIIRGNFIDSYTNLTLKTISAFEWVSYYCSEAKFVLKTDDDMFINMPRLLKFIDQQFKQKNVIFGRLARKWVPFRNNDSKYYLSETDYKPKVFPSFTTGPAYLLSSDVVPKLYEKALHHTYLKLEDVFMTGIIARKVGVIRKQATGFVNEKLPYSACNVQRSISIHKVKYNEQFDLWKKLLDGQSKCKESH